MYQITSNELTVKFLITHLRLMWFGGKSYLLTGGENEAILYTFLLTLGFLTHLYYEELLLYLFTYVKIIMHLCALAFCSADTLTM